MRGAGYQAIEFARSTVCIPTAGFRSNCRREAADAGLRAAAIWLQRPRARVYLVTPSEETGRQRLPPGMLGASSAWIFQGIAKSHHTMRPSSTTCCQCMA